MIFSPKTPQKLKPIRLSNTVDIETDANGDVMDLGMADTLGQYRTYPSWNAWIQEVANRDTKTYGSDYWAHNGGGFDWISLIEYLRETNSYEWCDVIIAGSKVIGITIDIRVLSGKKLNKQVFKIHLRDSTTILPESLAKLSHDFGVETPKIKIDCLPEALKKKNPKLYYEYLKADCISLQQILFRFHEIINDISPCPTLPITIASCAMFIFRSRYLKRSYHLPTTKSTIDFFRESYKGGRCEFFDTGEFGGVSSVDINSLYPSVMADTAIPVGSEGGWVDSYKRGDVGIYRGAFNQPENSGIPVLMDHETHKYVYHGEGVYCSVEIERLLEIGGSFICSEGYHFTNGTDLLFGDYVNDLYSRRKDAEAEGHTAIAGVMKLLLNSLYGKFGMDSERSGIVLSTVDSPMFDKRMDDRTIVNDYSPLDDDWTYFVVTSEKEFCYQLPHVASWITAQARVKLHELFTEIDKTGTVLYGDTDSCYFQGPIPQHIVGTKLGESKVEEENCTMIIMGKKLYGIKRNDGTEKVRAKGISVSKDNRNFGDDTTTKYTDTHITLNNPGLGVELQYTHMRESVLLHKPIICEYGSFPTLKEHLKNPLENKACRIKQKTRTITAIRKL